MIAPASNARIYCSSSTNPPPLLTSLFSTHLLNSTRNLITNITITPISCCPPLFSSVITSWLDQFLKPLPFFRLDHTMSMEFIVKVEESRPASDGKPSAGPVYRSIYAKDGLMDLPAGLESPWQFFRYKSYHPFVSHLC